MGWTREKAKVVEPVCGALRHRCGAIREATTPATPSTLAEKKIVLKLIPSGILRRGVQAVIGNGVVVDLAALIEEMTTLEANGIKVAKQLRISKPRARHFSRFIV